MPDLDTQLAARRILRCGSLRGALGEDMFTAIRDAVLMDLVRCVDTLDPNTYYAADIEAAVHIGPGSRIHHVCVDVDVDRIRLRSPTARMGYPGIAPPFAARDGRVIAITSDMIANDPVPALEDAMTRLVSTITTITETISTRKDGSNYI